MKCFLGIISSYKKLTLQVALYCFSQKKVFFHEKHLRHLTLSNKWPSTESEKLMNNFGRNQNFYGMLFIILEYKDAMHRKQ